MIKSTSVVGVTSDLTTKVKAGELVNLMAQQVGGKGGGRPDMAMAGRLLTRKCESSINCRTKLVKHNPVQAGRWDADLYLIDRDI